MKLASTLLASVIGLALAGSVHAVHLDPGGRGQVLIYPYYTVNNGQQTLLSVTNTSSAAQAVKVRFREGYNNREVMYFNVWLAPYDVWTAIVFALEDAGLPGQGAAIMTSDRSCTTPQFASTGLSLNGTPYVPFVNYEYSSIGPDGGPTGTARTREGYFEVIAMADVTDPLLSAIKFNASGMPVNCTAVQSNAIFGSPAVSTRPSGGLMGAASIINVGQGTLLSTRAEALGGFTAVPLYAGYASESPNLASVNDTGPGSAATANLFDSQGRAQQLTYGYGTGPSRPIDAVSAVLMADQVYNEYVMSLGLNAASDWVLTFPTKQFYVDPLISGSTVARPPFEQVFRNGKSPVVFDRTKYDRASVGTGYWGNTIGPPPPYPPLTLDYATTVFPFSRIEVSQSGVLASRLVTSPLTSHAYLRDPDADAGWMRLDLNPYQNHLMVASSHGKVLRGLPVIGFWATNLVNNNVSDGVLSNYSMAVRHATSVTCVRAGGTCD